MDAARIAQLLEPFAGPEELPLEMLEQLRVHLDLLVRWNARMNLTAVRDPDSIVTRHFGESVFAARTLFPENTVRGSLVDVGSGAGFPGLPIAMLRPGLEVTLLEAHGKKATFLKEVIRSTTLPNIRVVVERAENYTAVADVVTLRAVEDFAGILPVCARIVSGSGRLAALIGSSQVIVAESLIGRSWSTWPAVYFPGSTQRVLWIAQHRSRMR